MCNCGAKQPAPAAGMLKDIAIPVTGDMNDTNSIEVVLLVHPSGMTQYNGPKSQARYRVWQYGQTFRIYRDDLEEMKREGIVDVL